MRGHGPRPGAKARAVEGRARDRGLDLYSYVPHAGDVWCESQVEVQRNDACAPGLGGGALSCVVNSKKVQTCVSWP